MLVEAEQHGGLRRTGGATDAVVTSKTYPSARFRVFKFGDAMMRVLESAPDARSVTTTLGARGAVAVAPSTKTLAKRRRRQRGDVHR